MSTAVILLSIIALGIVVHGADGYPTLLSVNGSCFEIRRNNDFTFSSSSQLISGVYSITNFCGNRRAVALGYCDSESGGGGWLVVQRRQDGSISFNKGWKQYEEGFGSLNGEFWYGLKPLHCLTSQGHWELRIDLTHTNGTKTYLHYEKFAIGSASDKYPLYISQYKGIYPIDPFKEQPLYGMKFTTKDSDNDLVGNINCAVEEGNKLNSNGWWYYSCSLITLNIDYSKGGMISDKTKWHRYIFTEMKIKPKSCD